MKKRYPNFDHLTEIAKQTLTKIRTTANDKKQKFAYRTPKIRRQVIHELNRKTTNVLQLKKLLNTYIPTKIFNGTKELIEDFTAYMIQASYNNPTELDATRYTEFMFILQQMKKPNNNPYPLPSTVKWSRTLTTFICFRDRIHHLLLCNDGSNLFPIHYANEPELNIFNRVHTIPGLFTNTPFDEKFVEKLLLHFQPYLKDNQEHMFTMIPTKYKNLILKLCTIPISFIDYQNPLIFYRGNSFEIYSLCPIPISILAININNWNWKIHNDAMGYFSHECPPLPPQPQLDTHALAPTKTKIENIIKLTNSIPGLVQTKINNIEEQTITIKDQFITELALNALMTNKNIDPEKHLTMSLFTSKLLTKPWYQNHEKISLSHYLNSERNHPHKTSKQTKCHSCGKAGHMSTECIHRIPKWEEYNLKCKTLFQVYNFLTNRPKITPIRGELAAEHIYAIQRPLTWLLEDIFWSDLHDHLQLHELSINEMFRYYHSIRRNTAFGIGRQWALGASSRQLITMCFGVLLPHTHVWDPYEFQNNLPLEQENIVAEVVREKLNSGHMAIGKKTEARNLISYKIVNEKDKNRLIMRSFEKNDQINPPKFSMPHPSNMKILTENQLMMSADIASSFSNIPIAETCIETQALYLPYNNMIVFILGALEGYNLSPCIHEYTNGAYLDNCALNLSFRSRFMDDLLIASKMDNIISFKFFFENVTMSRLPLSPKMQYALSTATTFLGKTFSTTTHDYLPAAKHFEKLVIYIYELIHSNRQITTKLIFQLRGKIISMIDNYEELDTSPIDLLLAQSMYVFNVHITQDWEKFLKQKITLTNSVLDFLTESLTLLLKFGDIIPEKNTKMTTDKLYLITDAGEKLGGALAIYVSPNQTNPELQVFLKPYLIPFRENKRTVLGTSSTSREQNILHGFLTTLNPLFKILHKLHLKPKIIIVGDNQGLDARIRKGTTKLQPEQIELSDIIKQLNETALKYESRWERRTSPVIKLVDSIPRGEKHPFKITKQFQQHLKKRLHKKDLIESCNSNVLRLINPNQIIEDLNPTNLKPNQIFYGFPNPMKTKPKQIINLFNYFIQRETNIFIIHAENKHLTNFINNCPQIKYTLEFEINHQTFSTTQNTQNAWINAKQPILKGQITLFIHGDKNIKPTSN